MTLLRTLIYFFQEALLDLRRNKALYGFAWFVVALSLFVLGFSRYITGNVNALLRTWERDLEVRVFLEDDLDPVRLESAEQMFGKDLVWAPWSMSPRREALKILARLAPAFQAAGPSPGTSPLPPSLSLKLKAPLDLARVRALVASAGKEPGVAQVLFDWDWVDRLRAYSLCGVARVGAVRCARPGCGLHRGAICRIIALNRREEIVILHFVGATGSSIRGPFMAGA